MPLGNRPLLPLASGLNATAEAVDSVPYKRPPDLVVTDPQGGRCAVRGAVERDALVRALYEQVDELRLVVSPMMGMVERRGGLAAGEMAEAIETVRRAVDKRCLGYEPGAGGGPEKDNPFAGLGQ